MAKYREFKKGDLVLMRGLGWNSSDYITRVLEVYPKRSDRWHGFIKYINEDGEETRGWAPYFKILKHAED